MIEPPDNLPEILPCFLKPGDALLTSGDAWYSEPIQQITGSPWSHAAMVLPNGTVGEMTSPRCRIVRLDDWLESEGPAWACRLSVPLCGAQCAALEAYWQTRVGERYGYGLLIREATYALWQRFALCMKWKQWARVQPYTLQDVCSTTVADAWRECGLDPDEDTGMVPGDIPRQTFLRPIERITT